MKFLRLIFIPSLTFLILLSTGCAVGTMRGVVTDESGVSVPDVYVQVKEIGNSKDSKQVPVAVRKTDTGGEFEISNLNQQKTYSFTFSKKSYKDKDIVYDLRNISKKKRESLKIELEEIGLISGTVVDKDGKAIPFVFIEAKTDSGDYVATITTDEMGMFSIKGLDGDKIYKLSFNKYGYVPRNDVEFNLKQLTDNERESARIQLFKEVIEVKGIVMKLEGTSGEPLFDISPEFQQYLNSGNITTELLNAFSDHNITLMNTKVIRDDEDELWWMANKNPDTRSYFYYAVKMDNDKLNVYHPNYTPFDGLDVVLKKSQTDITWNAMTDSNGKFNISEQITSGEFWLEIHNAQPGSRYESVKLIPSYSNDNSHLRLNAGDSLDIGIVIMEPLPSIPIEGIGNDIREAIGGRAPTGE